MGDMNGQQQGYAPPAQDNSQEFYEEVDQIRGGIDTVNQNISRIESLHQQALKDIDESTSQQTQSQLEALVSETSALNNTLVSRIKILKGKAGRDPSKGPQVGVLDRNFKDALRKYQLVEKNFADRTREQMARQYRIVKPDATEEEVQQACEDSQGQQIFSQALLSGNRRGEARSALREVQARHTEIQRIEKTIIELAQLFNEMEQLVTEQEAMVENIDQRGEEITQNVDKAQEELGEAVGKARSARRKKWWCLLIVLLILIVIIIIALVVTKINHLW
ncbi:t-SNARE [Wilcoxina mikolae CBS 423.85]|nr:t-SNARE [Wilcoxina mikolae CBS 423.85]